MFVELVAAEKRLGPRQDIWTQVGEENIGGATITMSVGGPGRRDGFDILRDIITRYRRTWAAQHLDAYLEARWRTELSEVGRGYHQHLAVKGKEPTVKQFAKLAASAASSWFDGDLSEVYNVLGLRSPLAHPTYQRLFPADRDGFHRRMRKELEARARALPEQDRQSFKYREGRLAALGRNWILLNEAIGEPPTLRQFGSSEFKLLSVDLADDVEEAWAVYSEVVQAALTDVPPEAENHDALEPDGLQEAKPVIPHLPRSRPRGLDQSPSTAASAESADQHQRRGWLRRLVGG